MTIRLANEFTNDGWAHKQLRRHGNAAIYKRWRAGRLGTAAEIHYEVVRINLRKPYSRFGQEYPAAEHYPRSVQWGSDGWTFLGRKKAEMKFREIAYSAPAGARGNAFCGERGLEEQTATAKTSDVVAALRRFEVKEVNL